MSKLKTITIFLLFLCASVAICRIACSQMTDDKRLDSPGEFIVGLITHSPTEEYIIVEEADTKIKRLYKKDVYNNMEKKGLVFKESVLLEEVEYRYKPVAGGTKLVSEDFELFKLEDKKAILKKEYVDTPDEPWEETLIPEEEPFSVEDPLLEKETEQPLKKRGAKRLVSSLFYKIKSKKLSDTEWEISLPTILGAAANFGEVLGIVVEKISTLLEDESDDETGAQVRTKVYLKSSLGKVTLGPNGLVIESLSSRMKQKSGLKSDDIIKSVNGKSLTSIQSVTSVFSTFSGAAQTITVRILRDNEEEEITHTYYVR